MKELVEILGRFNILRKWKLLSVISCPLLILNSVFWKTSCFFYLF
jgi:hypothetical protein